MSRVSTEIETLVARALSMVLLAISRNLLLCPGHGEFELGCPVVGRLAVLPRERNRGQFDLSEKKEDRVNLILTKRNERLKLCKVTCKVANKSPIASRYSAAKLHEGEYCRKAIFSTNDFNENMVRRLDHLNL